jgi:hypothetical protein
MTDTKTDRLTQLLSASTAVAVLIVLWMLWGAGLFHPGGDYLNLEDLEHVGTFIGGVFTPLAVGWAARTFLLQREQMLKTLITMRQQNRLSRKVLEKTNEQFQLERDREIIKSDPQIQITKGVSESVLGSSYFLKVINHGETAQRIRVFRNYRNLSDGYERKAKELDYDQPLLRGESWKVSDSSALYDEKIVISITVLAERLDGLLSTYTFESDGLGTFSRMTEKRARPESML